MYQECYVNLVDRTISLSGEMLYGKDFTSLL